MKVVLDTNVIISAIVFGGKPRIIFELIIVEKNLTGVISRSIIDELLGVLKVKFKYSHIQLIKIEKLIEENFIITHPQNIPKIIKEDSFDNQILAIADETPIDYIISGDNHLLNIKTYKNILIVTPHYFVNKIIDQCSDRGNSSNLSIRF